MIVERLIVLVAALMETRLVVAANYAYSVRRPAWARRDLEPVAQMSHAANGVFRHQFRPKIPGLAEPRAARSEQPPPRTRTPQVSRARSAVLRQVLRFGDEIQRKGPSPQARSNRIDGYDVFSEKTAGRSGYEFGYGVDALATHNEHYRHEQRLDDGTVIGSYGLREPDGRIRIVDYVADAGGFRATVRRSQANGQPSFLALGTPEKGNNRVKRDTVQQHQQQQQQRFIRVPPGFLVPPPIPRNPRLHLVPTGDRANAHRDPRGQVVHHRVMLGTIPKRQMIPPGIQSTTLSSTQGASAAPHPHPHQQLQFKNPLPSHHHQDENKQQHLDQHHEQGHHHQHAGMVKQHVEPQIITAEDLKFQNSDDSRHVVKLSVGILVPSEVQTYHPHFPPHGGDDLQPQIAPIVLNNKNHAHPQQMSEVHYIPEYENNLISPEEIVGHTNVDIPVVQEEQQRPPGYAFPHPHQDTNNDYVEQEEEIPFNNNEDPWDGYLIDENNGELVVEPEQGWPSQNLRPPPEQIRIADVRHQWTQKQAKIANKPSAEEHHEANNSQLPEIEQQVLKDEPLQEDYFNWIPESPPHDSKSKSVSSMSFNFG